MRTYILNENHEPVAENDQVKLESFLGDAKSCIVKQDLVNGVKVFTVFLGLDHNFDSGPPILFETMVFGGINDQFQDRYHTWDEAVKGHEVVLSKVKQGLNIFDP